MHANPSWLLDAVEAGVKALLKEQNLSALLSTRQAIIFASAVLAFAARKPRPITEDEIEGAAMVLRNHGLGWQVALMQLALEAAEKARVEALAP